MTVNGPMRISRAVKRQFIGDIDAALAAGPNDSVFANDSAHFVRIAMSQTRRVQDNDPINPPEVESVRDLADPYTINDSHDLRRLRWQGRVRSDNDDIYRCRTDRFATRW